MNASVYRDTKFEIRLIQQGPNSFGLICSNRKSPGENVSLELAEELFTDEEMSKINDVLGLMENKFAQAYDDYIADPKNLLAELKKAEMTHKAELEKIKNEAAEEKRRLEAELAKLTSSNK